MESKGKSKRAYSSKSTAETEGTFIWGWKLLAATMEVAWLCRKDIAF